MADETDAPDAPLGVLLPVQLLHRISPWFPFFHMEEELVLQTAQHGFKPRGMFAEHKKPASVVVYYVYNGHRRANDLYFTTTRFSKSTINNSFVKTPQFIYCNRENASFILKTMNDRLVCFRRQITSGWVAS